MSEKRKITVGKTSFYLTTNFKNNKMTEYNFIGVIKRLLLQEYKKNIK